VEYAEANTDRMSGKDWRAALDAAEVPDMLRASVDHAFILDLNGIVVDQLGGTGSVAGAESWTGRPWRETVTTATRPKLERMLEEAIDSGVSRFRQLNHPVEGGEDVPMGYTLVRFGSPGHLLAVGRNLSALASLQRQLVEAQQRMETEYWHVRQAEARYRILFQQSSEPVFLLEADGLKVTDANNAACALLDVGVSKVLNRSFPPEQVRVGPTWDEAARDAFADELRQVALGTRERASIQARVVDRSARYDMVVSAVRFDGTRTLLVRLVGRHLEGREGEGSSVDVMSLLEGSPDGFVVTDDRGEIIYANDAFVNMAQVGGEQALVGRSLATWLGRPGADLTVLLTNLRNRGQIRLFPTEVQGEQGHNTPVEVSGVAALDSEEPCMGITLRDVSRRIPSSDEGPARELSGAVQRLSTKVGEVSLKELVEDTVGLVELHFIDAALELTGDNRTAAAELLGLSRQSLYTKLKRYNIDTHDD
jgi:transcriptional regulator PpsR